MLSFMLNILADLELNCCNVREFRNHFGEKNIQVISCFFLKVPMK